ncbi:hypothetical protein ACVMGC_001001 [Bradyrhizobium barranii subsp. barranii]|uniref:hypothetical protein n=1 Tax=Bradyrhizobium TaxID=374 RepID=UPI001BABBBE0|nr:MULTISPECIES: hypothetical protein [Bradyrhizobium]MBR0879603.1 hypothetical protein [Bradyrhizobium liaoningense]MCP1778845.1 hypothetical protein [Bradyrhizobium japonicum]MCP1958157.1 hypothetical protein [Bradyrhizobium japonicum]
MRVSIVVPDNILVVDGTPMKSDCAELGVQDIHAVQWFDDHGEVEYGDHNETIDDFAPFQIYVDNAGPLVPPERAINPTLNSMNLKNMSQILGGF